MEATLNALGQVLIQAVPTFLLVLFLHIYLRNVFFLPLAKVLAERSEATEGARKKAREALERAEAKATDYEASLRDARSELYKEFEGTRRQWLNEQAEHIAAARARSEAAVNEAKSALAAETQQAQATLAQNTQALADQITNRLLQGKAA